MSISTSTAALFSADSQNRALLACLCVSIALHASVLFSFPEFRARVPSGGPRMLTASFAPRPAQPEAAPAIEQTAPRPSEAPLKIRPDTLQPALIQPSQAQPIPQPPPVPQTPSDPAQTANAAPPAPQVPAQTAPAGAFPGEAVDFSNDAADASLLEKYRLALIDAVRRYRRYPPQAMERGWQGRVEIRLVIGASGMIKSASIRISSHYQILDDQALDMVKKGKTLAQIPAALRGREFTVDVPVIFELQTG
jgi:periplasmic protein TonB